jgi:hypothetical protein
LELGFEEAVLGAFEFRLAVTELVVEGFGLNFEALLGAHGGYAVAQLSVLLLYAGQFRRDCG